MAHSRQQHRRDHRVEESTALTSRYTARTSGFQQGSLYLLQRAILAASSFKSVLWAFIILLAYYC